jgi:hypothetical protein
MPNKDIIQEQVNYVRGLGLANDATSPLSKFTVGAGACQDSTATNDMVVAAALTLDGAVLGANGVDFGALAGGSYLTISSSYAVYIIGDSSGFNDVAAIMSLDQSAPLLPSGYDMYRRIGWVFTNGAKELRAFKQYGKAETREYMWQEAYPVYNAAAPVANETLDLDRTGDADQLVAAPVAGKVLMQVDFTPALATTGLDMQAYDAAPLATGQQRWLPGVAARGIQMMESFTGVAETVPGTPKPALIWKADVADAAVISVVGWTEYLA